MAGTATERAIVAGVDASEACLGAARWAAREAVLRGVTLRLIHGCFFGPDDKAHRGAAAHNDEEPLLEHGYSWLERAERAAADAAPGVRIETEVNPGIASDLLVDESAKADLIVVGSHGVGGLRGVFIGSVALKVAARASCPVVVVHGARPSAQGPVVAGVDASEESETALEFALAAAALRAVPLLVVHAWHDGVLAAGADLGAVESSELRALEDRMAGWCEKYPGVEVRLHAVRDRNAARALLRVTPDAQLIVIGSRGRGPFAGGLLGSTGNSLISRSACPVVVVHERNHADAISPESRDESSQRVAGAQGYFEPDPCRRQVMRAQDLMTSPVTTVNPSTSVKEAAEPLSSYGFTASGRCPLWMVQP